MKGILKTGHIQIKFKFLPAMPSCWRERALRSEDTISGTKSAPGIEHKVREFLKGKKRAGSGLTLTLVRFDEWLNSLEGEGDPRLLRPSIKASSTQASDAIEQIAETFIEASTGNDRQLLSKSLQEAMFECSGFAMDLNHLELRKKVRQFRRSQGPALIIQRFLSFYFFNFIWFNTGEAFRTRAWSTAAFEHDMERVEELCRKVVAEVWISRESAEGPLNASTARYLIHSIEERLLGKA
jgi:hypothetical protein